ncbi:MAG: twitching motility protein PilT [Rubrivivax sp. SCN 71-131]|jgi:predicted nucleic acid-binding protein|nr:MAG: twitching motility protein PilT [Rubrivivax sp. SCN 71-131]
MLRVAIDTNVLAYAEGAGDKRRCLRAVEVLEALPEQAVLLPVQVLGELFRVLVGKLRQAPRLAKAHVLRWTDVYAVRESSWQALQAALDLSADHGLTIWDALILSVAAEQRCRLLLSEDLQDGFSWRGTTVVNPFAPDLPSLLVDVIASSGGRPMPTEAQRRARRLPDSHR